MPEVGSTNYFQSGLPRHAPRVAIDTVAGAELEPPGIPEILPVAA
jgi:hypothetical protein